MMETADAQWVKSLVRQLTKCLELPILRNNPLREYAGNTSVIWNLNIYFSKLSMTDCIQSTDHLGSRHIIYRWCTLHLSQYSSKERAAALSLRIFICLRSLRTHWLAGCPVVMIDSSAEGPHCGELGQGVALFSLIVLILSPWLFSILTDSHRTTVKFLFISYLPCCLTD